IRLVSYEHLYALVFVKLAGGLDIDPKDTALRTKIMPPHVQAPAAVYSDFQHIDGSPPELVEMAMVNIEIVTPFPDTPPLSVRVEIRPQGIRRLGLRSAAFAHRGRLITTVPVPDK